MKTTQAVRALAALAQDDRLKLYRLLVKAGPQGMPAGQLARSSRMPAPTVSFHLAKLVAADLAWSRKEGRFVIYGPEIAAMNRLLGYLTDECCGGQPALCCPPGEP